MQIIQPIQPDLDIYALAYLANGVSRVSNTMVINLIERGFLGWDVQQKKLVRLEGVDGILTHLEQQVVEALVNGDVTQPNIIKSISLSKIAIIQADLKSYGINLNNPFDNAGFAIYSIGYRLLLWGFWIWCFGLLIGKLKGIGGFFVMLVVGVIGTLVVAYISYAENENAIKSYWDEFIQKKDNLLEIYRQQIPAHAPFLNSSLSKAYALYGSVILKDSKFDGLSEFLNPLLIHSPNRKNPEDGSYDLDSYYDSSFDTNSDSAGCSSYSGGDCGGD
ncbi:MAG: hypothetical protein ABL903_17415 [Methylococcales bacterium]